MRYSILLLLMLLSFASKAQIVSGTVYTSNGDLLPYASIYVIGTNKGASANNAGNYSLYLSPGKYTIRCQHVGYAPLEKEIVVSGNQTLNFILSVQEMTMEEVVVSTKEDPAYRIIREAIKQRKEYAKIKNSYIVQRYSKDIIKADEVPDKVFGQKIDKAELEKEGFDSTGKGVIYLSEAMSKIYSNPPDQFKMEVLNSRVSGSNTFGLTLPISVSLYQNNVTVFIQNLNPRGFISPISDNALNYYRYKLLGTFFDGDHMIYSIQLIPKREFEPLFYGTIQIEDGTWRIYSTDVYLTKKSQLELIDTLKLKQLYTLDKLGDKWPIQNQLLEFSGKFFGFGIRGIFHNVYTKYEESPEFDKKTFDNVLIKYDTGVTNKPKEWWDTIRPVPLTDEEYRDYQFKDSVYQVEQDLKNSPHYYDSLNKARGPIKPLSLIIPGIRRTHYSKDNTYSWGIQALLFNTNYNTVEGLNMTLTPYFMKKKIVIESLLRYGFSNQHFNPSIGLMYSRNSKDPSRYAMNLVYLSGGKKVVQFDQSEPIDPLSNTLSTLLWGNNYMKIHEMNYVDARYIKKTESGLRYSIGINWEDRIPVDNTTSYIFAKKKKKNLKPNYPLALMDQQFTQHQAAIINVGLQFQGGQKYMQFPKNKLPLGSTKPVWSLMYSKGIKDVLGSDVDFDKWKAYVEGSKNMKLAGTFKYKVGAAGFLNDKQVPVQDYWHVYGNETDALAHIGNAFQLAPYYGLSNKDKAFGFAHVTHHLNGLLSNKVPFFKEYNTFFVWGSNIYYAGNDKRYIEASFGIENLLNLLRIDVIGGFADNRKPQWGVKFGFGGLLGNSLTSPLNNSGVIDKKSITLF